MIPVVEDGIAFVVKHDVVNANVAVQISYFVVYVSHNYYNIL